MLMGHAVGLPLFKTFLSFVVKQCLVGNFQLRCYLSKTYRNVLKYVSYVDGSEVGLVLFKKLSVILL